MKLKPASILLILILTLIIGCKNANKKNDEAYIENKKTSRSVDNDSLALTSLIRAAYTWHYEKHIMEFPYKFDKESDSIFTGIDWNKYDQNMAMFKSSKFFTTDFIKHHKSIALILDTSIKNAGIKWRNINDGITVWDSEADDWCNCQDYPDKYWKTLAINHLNIENNLAHFSLSMKIGGDYAPMFYKIAAKKEHNTWKIDSLEGYSYYGTISDYNRMMQN